MQKEIVITPITEGKLNMSIPLICDFTDGTEKVKITTSWKVVRDRALTEDETLMVFNFSPIQSTHKITWDDAVDKSKSNCVELLKRHPQIQFDGNTNLKRPLFRLINSMDEKKKKALEIKQKGIIFNMVNNMTVETMRDIAFWNKCNPVGKDVYDIYIELIDFEKGILMKNQDKFFENYKVEGINYRVIAEKAIALKIMTMRGGFYYYDNTQIGKAIEDIMDFLMQNKDKFEYIKKEVMKLDQLPVDWTTKTVLEVLKFTVPTIKEQLGETKQQKKNAETDKIEELRSKAKKLGIDRSWLKTEENLIKEISDAEAKLTSVVA